MIGGSQSQIRAADERPLSPYVPRLFNFGRQAAGRVRGWAGVPTHAYVTQTLVCDQGLFLPFVI